MKKTLFGFGTFILLATIGGFILTSRAEGETSMSAVEAVPQSACVKGGQCGCTSAGQCGQSQCTGVGKSCGGCSR